MRFALDHPRRTAALVLVGTASECNARARQFCEGLAALAETRGMAPGPRRLGVSAAQAEQAPTDAATYAWIARAMASLNVEPLTPRLAELRCPVLIAVAIRISAASAARHSAPGDRRFGTERRARARARLVPRGRAGVQPPAAGVPAQPAACLRGGDCAESLTVVAGPCPPLSRSAAPAPARHRASDARDGAWRSNPPGRRPRMLQRPGRRFARRAGTGPAATRSGDGERGRRALPGCHTSP